MLTGLEIGSQDNRRYRLTASSQTVSIHNPRGAGWAFNNYFRDKHADIRYNSVYFQDQIKVNDQHKFVVGLRKDDYETDFHLVQNNGSSDGSKYKINDDMISTRLGYIFSPTENLTYYTSYSNSFLITSSFENDEKCSPGPLPSVNIHFILHPHQKLMRNALLAPLPSSIHFSLHSYLKE